MKETYLNDWNNKTEVAQDFEIAESKTKDIKILLASYGCGNYCGDAFVLFIKDGMYYEVNGSHCSCFGLEDQWLPEEANIKELYHRVIEGSFGADDWTGNDFAEELKEILAELLGEQ